MNKGDNIIKSGAKTTKITTDSNSLASFESVMSNKMYTMIVWNLVLEFHDSDCVCTFLTFPHKKY